MNRKAERGELQLLLDHTHLAVGTWAPGDGQTRYRFFPRTDAASSAADYHQGDGLYTALGRGEAVTWLRGYRTALSAVNALPRWELRDDDDNAHTLWHGTQRPSQTQIDFVAFRANKRGWNGTGFDLFLNDTRIEHVSYTDGALDGGAQ